MTSTLASDACRVILRALYAYDQVITAVVSFEASSKLSNFNSLSKESANLGRSLKPASGKESRQSLPRVIA